MKKCIVIPDSFKGFMSSSEVASIISSEIRKLFPECEVLSLPIADGSAGTIDCIRDVLHWGTIEVNTLGPFNDPVKARYAVHPDGNTAIIESAQAVGLALAYGRLDPSKASTYGIGVIVKDAISRGYKNIILALGGSCSNDGGAGFATALGVRFYDEFDNLFTPVGATLNHVTKIDTSECDKLIEGCTIGAMCDILSLMHGPNGTASIYSPQKGADINMVAMLDRNLVHLDSILKSELGKDVSGINGSGACGGLGAMLLAVFNANLGSGINYMLDIMNFDELCQNSDMIITGEGCLDYRSLRGKTVYGIASRVKQLGLHTPVVAVVGTNKLDFETIAKAGISSVVPITPTYMQYEESKLHCATNLRNAITRLILSRYCPI